MDIRGNNYEIWVRKETKNKIFENIKAINVSKSWINPMKLSHQN